MDGLSVMDVAAWRHRWSRRQLKAVRPRYFVSDCYEHLHGFARDQLGLHAPEQRFHEALEAWYEQVRRPNRESRGEGGRAMKGGGRVCVCRTWAGGLMDHDAGLYPCVSACRWRRAWRRRRARGTR